MMSGRRYIGEALFDPLKNDGVADIKHYCGCKPRDRVGDVKRTGGPEFRKNGVDPNNSHRASTDQADDHRGC